MAVKSTLLLLQSKQASRLSILHMPGGGTGGLVLEKVHDNRVGNDGTYTRTYISFKDNKA